MNLSTLSLIDKPQAEQCIKRVELDDEFEACLLRRPRGMVNITIFSLKELYHFFEGSSQSIPSAHFTALATWIEHTIGDPVLAEVFTELEASELCYVDMCKQARIALETRLIASYAKCNAIA